MNGFDASVGLFRQFGYSEELLGVILAIPLGNDAMTHRQRCEYGFPIEWCNVRCLDGIEADDKPKNQGCPKVWLALVEPRLDWLCIGNARHIHRLFGYWKPYSWLYGAEMPFRWVASFKAFNFRFLGFLVDFKRFCEVKI